MASHPTYLGWNDDADANKVDAREVAQRAYRGQA